MKPFSIILICLLISNLSNSQTIDSLTIEVGQSTFDAKVIAKNLEIPWDLVWGPDNALWFTEKKGTINRINPETGEVQLIGKVNDVYVSEKENAGMHSMCFHPNWPDSSYLFVHYVNSEKTSKIERFKIDIPTLKIVESKPIITGIIAARSHNGSRMIIDSTNNILISIGDGYLFYPAQELNSLNGKVLRFTPSGGIPKDNPFPNSYTWSLGHRNPQGLVYASNGKLYCSEHGPTTDDEINIIQKGGNYGWPKVNGFCDLPSEQQFCEQNKVIEPLWIWTPTNAPSGITYYDKNYFPEWNNNLLQAYLKGRSISAMQLNEDGTKIENDIHYFENDYYRLRDVEVANDGSVYLATSNKETTLPPVKDEDDKIVHITSLNSKNSTLSFNSIQVDNNLFEVEFINDDQEGRIQLTTFYGGEIVGEDIAKNSKGNLNYLFKEQGTYWLKFIKKDRIITKLIIVKTND
jgi:glucose/arabinose dehydrogenase